jgi:calcineurin-like phosphoesterase family protein
MMPNIFFIADQHFHHKNILTFKRSDNGLPLRQFDDVDEMNEHMVEQHNRVVKPEDKVYFLGDVTMSRNAKGLEILGRLNGEKILVKGNHDLCSAHQYLNYFKDIRGTHQFDGMILSHIPIHPESLARWGCNVHGHLHSNQVKLWDMMFETEKIDPRYLCVSVEQIAYTPISLEDTKKLIKSRLETYNKF